MKILSKKKIRQVGANILACQIMINKYDFADKKEQVEIFAQLSENLCSLACDIGGLDMAYTIQQQAFPRAYT